MKMPETTLRRRDIGNMPDVGQMVRYEVDAVCRCGAHAVFSWIGEQSWMYCGQCQRAWPYAELYTGDKCGE